MNDTGNTFGGVVYVGLLSSALVTNNFFLGNSDMGSAGSSVYVEFNAQLVLTNNSFTQNTGPV